VPKNEGLLTASKVQYCAMSANYFKDGFKYNGELKVLGNILDNYLYEEIRAKGGAYGCGSNFSHKGVAYFYSYRDPHVEATFDVFKKAADYIRTLDISSKEMEKYIIGTIRAFDKPATNAHKGLAAANNHIQGWSDDARQKERDEILGADVGKMRSYANLIEAACAQNNICAVGSAAAIEGKSIFNSTRRV